MNKTWIKLWDDIDAASEFMSDLLITQAETVLWWNGRFALISVNPSYMTSGNNYNKLIDISRRYPNFVAEIVVSNLTFDVITNGSGYLIEFGHENHRAIIEDFVDDIDEMAPILIELDKMYK